MNRKLYKAAAKGEIGPFNKIAKDELGSIVTHNKNTVLHAHIESKSQKSLNFVKQILEMCPSLLVQVNAKGDAPLHVAAKCGHPDVVEALIGFAEKQPKELESSVEGARQMLEMTNEEQNTGLHEAVQHCSLDVVKKLIKADPDVSYSTNRRRETTLYIAAANGSVEIVDEILDNCPSAAAEGPDGTALHAAVIRRTEGVIKPLVEKKKSLCREKDQYGWTPLHHAAYSGDVGIVLMLLKFDELLRSEESSAFIADEDRKMTALHLAASQGHSWTVREIIRLCPKCIDLVDDRKWNVLHFAMASLHPIQLKPLMDSYPELINLINCKDNNGNTPLHVCAALSRYSTYKAVPGNRNDKDAYHIVNNQNVSVAYIIHYGYDELKKEIQELRNDFGQQGQYRNGVVQRAKDKSKILYWIDLDDAVIGTKGAKESHLLVAALIATVTFAAAFTVPGGYKSEGVPNQGTAILIRTTAFQAFVISDGIAMVLSLLAVFVHFIMSLKAFQRSILLFMFAFFFTIIAMVAMVIAFVTGTYAVLSPSLWLAIPTCIVGLSFLFLVFFMFYTVYGKRMNRGLRLAEIKKKVFGYIQKEKK